MSSEKIKGDIYTDFSGHWTEAREEGKVIIDKDYILALEAENKRLHGLVCRMCDGHGVVGNCFDSIDCPDCSLYNAHDDAITENSERLQAENKRLKEENGRLTYPKFKETI